MKDELSDAQLMATLKRLDRIAELSDSKFRIPFTRIRFGVDALIGLIPILGETIGLLISLTILFEASKIGVPRSLKIKMLRNIALDWLIGLVPIAGDIADVAFKANVRNMKLLVTHIDEERKRRANTDDPAQNRQPRLMLYILSAILILAVSISMLLHFMPV